MRVRVRLALLGLVAASALTATADEPAPLLKPVVPAGTGVRVRLPVTPGFPEVVSFPAQVRAGKGLQVVGLSEWVDVKVAYDTLSNPSYVSATKLASWGYVVPKGAREFVLPELLIPAAQIAGKLEKPKDKGKDKEKEKDGDSKSNDVTVRLTNVKFVVIPEEPTKDGKIHFCDLCLSSTSLLGTNERAMEPRLSFGDKFLELTVPQGLVKHLGTGTVAVPDVTANNDAKLVVAVAPTTARNGRPATFTYAAVNGQDAFKTGDGKAVQVNVEVASINNLPDGVRLSIGAARPLKVEIEKKAGMVGTGVDTKSEFAPGKIAELRIGLLTGPGLKTQKDLVIKDVPVFIDMNRSEPYIHIGQKFLDTYFADAVYSNAGDGWKLHGRVNPDLLFDIKTRKKP